MTIIKQAVVEIAAVLLLTFTVSSQVKARSVDQGQRYDNAPLVVLSCSVGNVVFPECKNVRGDGDWWTQLTFAVQNRSAKTISSLDVDIYVEKQGSMQSGLAMNVRPKVSLRMVADAYGWPSGRYGIRIAPGEVFDMAVTASEAKLWKQHLATYDVNDLGGFRFQIRGAYFDDGTNWFFGRESSMSRGESVDPTRKLIKTLHRVKNEPVEIVGLRADGVSTTLGVPFTGGEDWLRDLAIIFKNVSGRTILSVEFHLRFLASFPTGPNRGDTLIYGLSPNVGQWDMEKMRALKPDGQDEVKMDAAQYKGLKAFLAYDEDIATRTTAEVQIDFVWFADGTRWQYGSYYKPDPNKPGEFIRENGPSNK